MSREKILEYFKDINHAYNDCTRYDTLKSMINELQEPCTDAISREAVLKCFTLDNTKADVWNNIKALLPVTSKLIECGDCVSRQAVLDMLEDINAETEGVGFYYTHYVEYIKKLPPVTPQYTEAEIQKMQDLEFAEIQKAYEIGKAENPNKWIPVSERLPEKTDFYLIQHTRKYCPDEMAVAFYSPQEANADPNYTWEFETIADVQEVIAWMPLPEPYKTSPTGAERSEE